MSATLFQLGARDAARHFVRSKWNTRSVDLMGKLFGRLTVSGFFGYTDNGGPRHTRWLCVCECGNERTVRGTRLTRSEITACVSCSRAEADRRRADSMALPGIEAALGRLLGHYKANAVKRGLPFLLSRADALSLFTGPCFYCGCAPAARITSKSQRSELSYNGIDRKDNSAGYTAVNSVPCCVTCNFAKRTMSISRFAAWVEAVYARRDLWRAA